MGFAKTRTPRYVGRWVTITSNRLLLFGDRGGKKCFNVVTGAAGRELSSGSIASILLYMPTVRLDANSGKCPFGMRAAGQV